MAQRPRAAQCTLWRAHGSSKPERQSAGNIPEAARASATSLARISGRCIYLGYRHCDKAKAESLFPFGFGLSHTSFAYANTRLSSPVFRGEDDTITVSVDIASVWQGVSAVLREDLPRPVKELKGFATVQLAPGERKTASYVLGRYALGHFNYKPVK